MKFLCDRCKTRYSIGDDRVRGKILKIRCKNCANVITVREGMSDVDASPADDDAVPLIKREKRTTTMAPDALNSMPTPPPAVEAVGALGAAFATAMAAKPPAALEEEWYVSLEGEQQGPYSLAEALKWIGEQAPDADLHCWSEGFDDWLPVDKVSHFRGARKKAPPPPPRATPPAAPAPAARPQRTTMSAEAQARFGRAGGPSGEGAAGPAGVTEAEPKPLFAATMASLETAPAAHATHAAPSAPKATPATGVIPTLRANGTSAASASSGVDGTASPAKPAPTRAETVPGVGGLLGRAWDSSDRDDDSDPPTTAEALPFNDLTMKADPSASAALREAFAAMPAPSAAPAPASIPLNELADGLRDAAAPTIDPRDPGDGDDDLDIGEVSRVVNLADLAKQATQARKDRSAPVRRTGASPAIRTAAMQKLDPADVAASGLAATATAGEPAGVILPPVEPAAPAPEPVASRRGLFILLGIGGALVVGLVVLVIMLVGNKSDDEPGDLGHVGQVDTQRPDDPLHHFTNPATNPGSAGSATVGPGSAAVVIRHPVGPTHPTTNGSNNVTTNTGDGGKTEVDLTHGAVTALKAEEVEDMSGKQGMGTQRCYEQALKKDPFLDVKRITVTISVDAPGAVTDVKLSDHEADMLGKCLASRIRGWKFRASTAGITAKITMVFSQG